MLKTHSLLNGYFLLAKNDFLSESKLCKPNFVSLCQPKKVKIEKYLLLTAVHSAAPMIIFSGILSTPSPCVTILRIFRKNGDFSERFSFDGAFLMELFLGWSKISKKKNRDGGDRYVRDSDKMNHHYQCIFWTLVSPHSVTENSMPQTRRQANIFSAKEIYLCGIPR